MGKRGTPPGYSGNPPHKRNAQAAVQIEILSGYGLPHTQISRAVEALFTDQGYSTDTLQKHYRTELDAGMAKARVQLMQGAYDRAFGRNIPQGVTPDAAYREAGTSIKWLANSIHGIVEHQSTRLSGPDGGAIQIENVDLSHLTDDELATLERISARLAAARDSQG